MEVTRRYDVQELQEALSLVPQMQVVCDLPTFVSDTDNIILGVKDDLAAFEFESPGVFSGHYLFKSRGGEAFSVAKAILKEMFETYNAKVIQGLTPLYHKGALLMNKKLGFRSYGTVETFAGEMEIYILTKEEFEDNK